MVVFSVQHKREMSDKFLRKVNSLKSLSADALQAFMSKMNLQHVKRNGLLLSEGEKCTRIYFVENGCFRSVLYKDGKEINLSFALETEFVTNLRSLREESPSEYYIKACEQSTVWSFAKSDMLQLYREYPELNDFGRILLEQLLMEQEDHANILKVYTPAEHYAHIMSTTPELLQKVSLTQLSSYLGISRESLSRIRKAR